MLWPIPIRFGTLGLIAAQPVGKLMNGKLKRSPVINSQPKTLQVSRQSKRTGKTRFQFLIENGNYDWLLILADSRGLSAAAALNELLRNLRNGVPRGIVTP